MASPRIVATYHVASEANDVAQRAKGLAIEQSVECPLEAIDDPVIHDTIVGRVEDIAELQPGRYAVRIGLAAATAPAEPGQLINMLFGNSSIQQDVALVDVELPPELPRCIRRSAARARGIAGADRRAGQARADRLGAEAARSVAGRRWRGSPASSRAAAST